jgi:hypothetical protein
MSAFQAGRQTPTIAASLMSWTASISSLGSTAGYHLTMLPMVNLGLDEVFELSGGSNELSRLKLILDMR